MQSLDVGLWELYSHDLLPFEVDRYVYHYTKWEVARDHILGGKRTIKISSAQRLNDLLEFQGFTSGWNFKSDANFSPEFERRMYPIINNACKKRIRVFATSLDKNPIIQSHPDGPIIHQEGCRGFAHPPMWAHYAENHAGVCLILDRIKIDHRIREHCSAMIVRDSRISYFHGLQSEMARRRVHVESNWQGLDDSQLSSKVLDFFNNLETPPFLMKHTDWRYENEYRWVVLGGDMVRC
jgi:Protein of unknown function (DUF2971)